MSRVNKALTIIDTFLILSVKDELQTRANYYIKYNTIKDAKSWFLLSAAYFDHISKRYTVVTTAK